MKIDPHPARYRLEITADGLRAVVPCQRHAFVVIFLAAWLIPWFAAEAGTLRSLFSSPDHPFGSAFLAAWLIGWTLGGLWAAANLVWQLAGREVITANALILSRRIEVAGLGFTYEYRATEVRRLRATEGSSSLSSMQRGMALPIGRAAFGAISFDYGARTVRMASPLDEAEAHALVQELAARLPASALAA